MKSFLFWLPRILSILFILFISLFTLDVFNEKMWFWALLIHLIPSLILSIFTVIAWKNKIIGGYLWVLAGLILLLISRNNLRESWIIAVPPLIIGWLFLKMKSSKEINKLKKE